MTTLTDGPAAGTKLRLTRTPRLLRVVQNGAVINALDQLDDEPEDMEIIYVYRLLAPVTAWTFGRGGREPVASYAFLCQPADCFVRLTSDWETWVNYIGRPLLRQLAADRTTESEGDGAAPGAKPLPP